MSQRILLACGIASSLVWLGADVITSLLYEGYQYPFQPISGLSALDSPVRPLVIPFFYLYLALKIAFAVGIWMTAGGERRLQITAGALLTWGIFDLAANFFPWDPNQDLFTPGNIIHGILAGGLALILMLLTIIFGAKANGKVFRNYSYGTLLVFLLAGGLMGVLGNPGLKGDLIPWWFGLAERINTYGFMVWMLVLAVILLHTRPAGSNQAAGEIITQPDRDPS